MGWRLDETIILLVLCHSLCMRIFRSHFYDSCTCKQLSYSMGCRGSGVIVYVVRGSIRVICLWKTWFCVLPSVCHFYSVWCLFRCALRYAVHQTCSPRNSQAACCPQQNVMFPCSDIWNVKMYFISFRIEANIECQAILKTYELFIYGNAALLIQSVKEVH